MRADLCDGGLVRLEHFFYVLLVAGMETASVDVIVLTADVELVSLVFRKIHACGIDCVSLTTSAAPWLVLTGRRIQIEHHLWFVEHSERPKAALAVVADTHNVVGVLGADYCELVDGVGVDVLGEAGLLDGDVLCPHVPLQNVALVGGANHHRRLERVENRLRDFVLREKLVLRPLAQCHRKQVYHAVGIIRFPLA